MITILFITFCFYLIAELVKQGAARKARKREMARQARIAEEMRKDREERQRVLEEQRQQREAMIAYEKEMRRLHLEQMREEKERQRLEAEQARQAAEQQRQAEILRKHEEQLFRIEQKLELAKRDEKHYSDEVTAITIDMKGIEAYVGYMKSKGLPCKTKEAELEKLSKKLYAAETKVIKARQVRELCERQMQAA